MTEEKCNSLPEWKPGQDICLIIKDTTLLERSIEEINDMFDVIRCAAKNQGFELSIWGLRPSFESSIQKKYVRAKIEEAVKARDLQLIQLQPEACSFLKNEAPPLPEVKH